MRSPVNISTVPLLKSLFKSFMYSNKFLASRMRRAMTMVIVTPVGGKVNIADLGDVHFSVTSSQTFFQLKSLFKSFSPMNYYKWTSGSMGRRAMTMVIVTTGCSTQQTFCQLSSPNQPTPQIEVSRS